MYSGVTLSGNDYLNFFRWLLKFFLIQERAYFFWIVQHKNFNIRDKCHWNCFFLWEIEYLKITGIFAVWTIHIQAKIIQIFSFKHDSTSSHSPFLFCIFFTIFSSKILLYKSTWFYRVATSLFRPYPVKFFSCGVT